MGGGPRDRVLDAFEEAVLLHGVQGSSFARIAAVGGFHRSLVQHHFGTRRALVEAALDRIVDAYVRFPAKLLQDVPPVDHLETLVGWLLSPFPPEGPPRIASVIDAYQALANTDPGVRAGIRRLYRCFTDDVAAALVVRYPNASPERIRDVALAAVFLSFGRAGLDTLEIAEAKDGAAMAAFRALTATLE